MKYDHTFPRGLRTHCEEQETTNYQMTQYPSLYMKLTWQCLEPILITLMLLWCGLQIRSSCGQTPCHLSLYGECNFEARGSFETASCSHLTNSPIGNVLCTITPIPVEFWSCAVTELRVFICRNAPATFRLSRLSWRITCLVRQRDANRYHYIHNRTTRRLHYSEFQYLPCSKSWSGIHEAS